MFKFRVAGLLENGKCQGNEETVTIKITTIEEKWTTLIKSCKIKTQKLQEASQQQTFFSSVKDLDFWLGEVMVLFKDTSDQFSNFISSSLVYFRKRLIYGKKISLKSLSTC